jgi:hypothetical protein
MKILVYAHSGILFSHKKDKVLTRAAVTKSGSLSLMLIRITRAEFWRKGNKGFIYWQIEGCRGLMSQRLQTSPQ